MSFFGKNIRKIRNAKNISQSVFAELFNLTRASIGAYEEGRSEAKIDTVIEIANYFDVSLDQLLKKELTINEIFHINKRIQHISEKDKTSNNKDEKPENKDITKIEKIDIDKRLEKIESKITDLELLIKQLVSKR